MGTCLRCGMSGPFVKIDGDGLCVICRKKAPPPPKKTLSLNPEQVILRYLTTFHNTYPSDYNVVEYYLAEFDCMLDSLPSSPIVPSPCNAPSREPECLYIRKFEGVSPRSLGDFVAIDTETSGLGPGAEIIEVSAVKFEHFRPVRVFETLCKPLRPISPSATAVNGITNGMVKNAPSFGEIISDLDDFTDGYPFVAHNAPFDMRMLAGEGFCTAGRKVFDTLPLARGILRDRNGEKLQSYKLAEACKQCAILFSGSHRSTADAFAAGLLFSELIKRHYGTQNLLSL